MALDHIIGPMVHVCDSQIEERGAAEDLRLSDLGAIADYAQDAESYQHLSISEGHGPKSWGHMRNLSPNLELCSAAA